MARLSFYHCFKCKSPYFGGLKECGNMLEAGGGFKEEELICGKCASKMLGGQIKCPQHNEDYIEFKCRYCCEVAQWFCFGTTHFCDPCHRVAGNNKVTECTGKADDCPLKMDHPPNGEEYAIGGGLCRHGGFEGD